MLGAEVWPSPPSCGPARSSPLSWGVRRMRRTVPRVRSHHYGARPPRRVGGLVVADGLGVVVVVWHGDGCSCLEMDARVIVGNPS